jgi:DEAD/DEAH box helicase domain-containing protein
MTDYEAVATDLSHQSPETLWGLALGEWLRRHPLFESLLLLTAEGPLPWTELLRQLSGDPLFKGVAEFARRGEVLAAFMALVNQALELRSGRAFPLAPVQVQLWMRELRRLGGLVSESPAFTWLDEPHPERKQLPVVHCTECGEIAWAALHDPDYDSLIRQTVQGFRLRDDAQAIYEAWGFERAPSPRLVILSPWSVGDDPVPEDGQLELEETRMHLAPDSLVVRQGPGPCPITREATFAVKVVHESRARENGVRVGVQRCPHCGAEESLMFIGSRAATLASVAIDEVFGSVLNSDPKLLAFTDSVQDASHRAGFFSARTYHFTLRTALQHLIDDAGEAGLPLMAAGEGLLDYWSQPQAGRPGSSKEAVATLIPPDLREYAPYLAFRNDPGRESVPPPLRQEIAERLCWEATSEFSLMLTHGRTMELHASATLGWDEAAITGTIDGLRDRFPSISPALESLTDEQLRIWILGVLHRQRERGALHHPYLDSYAAQNYWGKHPFGRAIAGRETHPLQGRYKPRLFSTHPDRYHDHVLAPSRPGQQKSWQLVWMRRVLGLPGVDDGTLLDLLHQVLRCGAEAGLLRMLHRDGDKELYAIAGEVARLFPAGRKLTCSESGYTLFRPVAEAELWEGAPSLAYRAPHGRYCAEALNERERYYRERYRKGALRRVFAHEHTGLLNTEERENLELEFNGGAHADAPNVLTATSTLEMGIDIGDFSTTMLCSIPPTAASYLQRIGRAGRKTGTALVLSIINQRPHDLFFYARPQALLAGEIDPPGCWLDASAMLVRQYLAFCFDRAVRLRVLTRLPSSGKQLVDELIHNRAGAIPDLLAWILSEEASLQAAFLARFEHDAVQDDTRERFFAESRTELLRERMEQAAAEFHQQRVLLENAQKRVRDQKNKLEGGHKEELLEIEREEKILSARRRKLAEISALEVLTEHGLLPNYAFPERGVRFSGTVYHRSVKGDDAQIRVRPPIEVVRAGMSAIRDLAPWNRFHTHSHRFDIQQLELGSKSQPLLERWAVCGQCGHMRLAADLARPETTPACPQCGYDGPAGQSDQGQQRDFLPFHRSHALSYMEYYDSLSADKGEERVSERYQLVTSFDQTVEQATGAVAEESLPFGIEYRGAMVMREVNAGYGMQNLDLEFGLEQMAPSRGFEVCADCGVVVGPGKRKADVHHRRSCIGHRETQRRKSEGRPAEAYSWSSLYLYRELRSEAIRLLLPDIDPEEAATLEAAIYLGMRLRFQGDPNHLVVRLQRIPDHAEGVTRNYLVLMDGVPGGTGFLKTLFQETDDQGLAGEGVMDVMSRALDAMETCRCATLGPQEDSDGCYRCIRTYHLQYRAEEISRHRGVGLLRRLIAAGEARQTRMALEQLKPKALYDSVLEKRFVTRLREWVEQQGSGAWWREALVAGGKGFEFALGDGRNWSLRLHPRLGPAQGVSIACEPDFLLASDDEGILPLAIFTDGFEYHVKPGEADSRLPDDLRKRRAIIESGGYRVWSLTWDDLATQEIPGAKPELFVFLQRYVTQKLLPTRIAARHTSGQLAPDIEMACGGPFGQLLAYIRGPESEGWIDLARSAAGLPLFFLAGNQVGQEREKVEELLPLWCGGYAVPPLGPADKGDWVWNAQLAVEEGDLMVFGHADDLLAQDFSRLGVVLRLGDSEQERAGVESCRARWRRFLAMLNLFQFAGDLACFTVSETLEGTAPLILLQRPAALSDAWGEVLEESLSSLETAIQAMAQAGCQVPEVEYIPEELDEELFAELAWPEAQPPIALLMGDQAAFRSQWQEAGWQAFSGDEIQAHGAQWLVDQLPR